VSSPVIAISGGTSDKVYGTWQPRYGRARASCSRSTGSQQELGAAGVATSDARDFCVEAAKIEFATRPGWLEGGELHVLGAWS
jgi:hypothetical protein